MDFSKRSVHHIYVKLEAEGGFGTIPKDMEVVKIRPA
jgi:hypothetical protein